jgi:hydrogenase maturation protein HypF
MEIEPRQAVHDLHPDYHSTQVAGQLGLPTLGVQHHEAHAWAGAAEHHLSLPALALVWDGTGYGHDGSVWGGEVFRLSKSGAERIAHLRPFPLPGGEAAVREPRRSALGLLAACMGPDLDPEDPMLTELGFSREDIPILLRSLRLGSPVMCSSMGRLFDAVSALCGFCTHNEYEGQAAIVLEHAASLETPANGLRLTICPGIPAQLDWEPWLTDFLSQQKQGKDPHDLAAQWHETLAATATAIAEHAGLESVLLTGGCFQNRRLTERCLDRLQTAGFRPYIPLQVPPNDGGIAFGQLASLAYTQLK